jgi:transcriptional regulator with XRE-family HTH domain
MEIGVRLKELRQRRGLTLENVARPLGVTRSCISQWERGRSAPGAKYFERLSRILETSAGYLMTGMDERPAVSSPRLKIEAPDIVLRARQDIARAFGVEVTKVRVEIDHF